MVVAYLHLCWSDYLRHRLTRLCGISLITLYGLIAAIGDIKRFVNARKLSAYLGLNPSVEQSSNYEGSTSLKRHGCGGCSSTRCHGSSQLELWRAHHQMN